MVRLPNSSIAADANRHPGHRDRRLNAQGGPIPLGQIAQYAVRASRAESFIAVISIF